MWLDGRFRVAPRSSLKRVILLRMPCFWNSSTTDIFLNIPIARVDTTTITRFDNGDDDDDNNSNDDGDDDANNNDDDDNGDDNNDGVEDGNMVMTTMVTTML